MLKECILTFNKKLLPPSTINEIIQVIFTQGNISGNPPSKHGKNITSTQTQYTHCENHFPGLCFRELPKSVTKVNLERCLRISLDNAGVIFLQAQFVLDT